MELSYSAKLATTVSVIKCPRCGKNFTIRASEKEDIDKYKKYFLVEKCFCHACRNNHLLCLKKDSDKVFTEEFEEKLKNFEYEDKITTCKFCGKLLFRSETEQRYDMSMGVDHDYDVCNKCAQDADDFTSEMFKVDFPEESAEWEKKIEKCGPVEKGDVIRKANLMWAHDRELLEKEKTQKQQAQVCARCGREELGSPMDSGEFLCEYHRNIRFSDKLAKNDYEDAKVTCECCGKTFLATKGQIYEKDKYDKMLLCVQCYYDLK